MDPVIESIQKDAAELLALAVPAFAAQKKVAALEQKVAGLEQSKVARDETIKTAAIQAADFFETRGMLKISRDEFIEQLVENPAIIFDAVQRFADHSTLKEAGSPAEGSVAENEMDAIERFCSK